MSVQTHRGLRVAALAISAAGLLAAGCGSALAAKTTLTVGMWLNTAANAKYTQTLLNDYAKKTGINIKLVHAPWDGFLDKLLAMAAAGQMPDVVLLSRVWLPRFAENKLVRPLDDLITAEKFDPKLQLAESKSGYYARKFYGFPIRSGPTLQYYNPAMFTNAGVPDPNQLVSSNRWTWADFVEVGRKLTKDSNGDGKTDIFAIEAMSPDWQVDWVPKIRQNGGDVFDEAYKKVLVNQPAGVEGLQYWADLTYRYGIAPKPGQAGGLLAKKSAMANGWLSTAVTQKEQQYRKSGIDMQLTLLPAGKAGYVTVAGGCPVCVSASTKHFKEAYKLAKWFSMDSDDWKDHGTPASRTTFEGAFIDFLAGHFTGIGAVLKRAMANTDPEPSIHPRNQLIDAAQMAALVPLAAGRISAAQAAQRMADDLTRILARK